MNEGYEEWMGSRDAVRQWQSRIEEWRKGSVSGFGRGSGIYV
jgi:hypothetical protein